MGAGEPPNDPNEAAGYPEATAAGLNGTAPQSPPDGGGGAAPKLKPPNDGGGGAARPPNGNLRGKNRHY